MIIRYEQEEVKREEDERTRGNKEQQKRDCKTKRILEGQDGNKETRNEAAKDERRR